MHSQLGPDDCVDNVTISMSEVIISVPSGTVCVACNVGGEVAVDAVFQIDNTNINGSIGRVVDGVLVVFDTESVFSTSSATDMQCGSVHYHAVVMYLESKSYNTESPFHDVRAYIHWIRIQTSSNHWDDHPQ